MLGYGREYTSFLPHQEQKHYQPESTDVRQPIRLPALVRISCLEESPFLVPDITPDCT